MTNLSRDEMREYMRKRRAREREVLKVKRSEALLEVKKLELELEPLQERYLRAVIARQPAVELKEMKAQLDALHRKIRDVSQVHVPPRFRDMEAR